VMVGIPHDLVELKIPVVECFDSRATSCRHSTLRSSLTSRHWTLLTTSCVFIGGIRWLANNKRLVHEKLQQRLTASTTSINFEPDICKVIRSNHVQGPLLDSGKVWGYVIFFWHDAGLIV
jgi:hypothetical protein